ncbi:MAG: DUF3987 domain-containing protein [Rhodospirillaceae bacterium]
MAPNPPVPKNGTVASRAVDKAVAAPAAAPPTTLLRAVSPAAPYPVDALGPLLSPAAAAIAARTQTPPALCAQAVLAVAALAAQRHIDVRLPTGEQQPASALFLCIAEAGERVGAVNALAFAPVRAAAARMKAARPLAAPRFLRDGADSRAHAWGNVGGNSLLHGADCAALVSAAPSRRRADALGLCALWDGADKCVRLSAHLVVARNDAARFFADADLAARGVLGRVLAVHPRSCVGAREWRGAGAPAQVLIAYNTRIAELLSGEEPKPQRVISFSPAAAGAWFDFAAEIERGMSGYDAASRALACHLPEHAARLAAILAFMADPEAAEIAPDFLAGAIALARHYASEALRLPDLDVRDGSLGEAEELLGWLQRTHNGHTILLRDVYRKGPPSIRDAKTARRLMRELFAAGAVVPKRRGPHGINEWEVIASVPQDAATMSRDVA